MSASTVVRAQAGDEAAFAREANAFRVLSWNVSQENFFRNAEEFRAFFRLCAPDILLLDEIPPGRTPAEVTSVLRAMINEADTAWNAVIGTAGGHQHGAIVSKYPLEAVAELDGMQYPARAVARLKSMAPDSAWNERIKSSLETGIPAMAAIVQMKTRAVLAVTVDLQCCNSTNDWQEVRRQIEAQEIRSAIHRVLARRSVDAILLAGDLNLVSSATPLVMLTNPYPSPHFALVPVNAVQLDGTELWTWDGRGSPFPSRALDFSFYTPASLQPVRALVLSTEDFSRELLSSHRFEPGTSRKLSDHLPILVDYRWQSKRP
jgi:hypothetical protein